MGHPSSSRHTAPISTPAAASAAAKASLAASGKGAEPDGPKGHGRPAARAAPFSAAIHTPPGELSPPQAKTRRLGEAADSDEMEDMPCPAVPESVPPSPDQGPEDPSWPSRCEEMFRAIMATSIETNAKLDATNLRFANHQLVNEEKFEQVHSLLAAQGNRIAELASAVAAPGPPGACGPDPALDSMKIKVDSLEKLIKDLRVDPPAAPAARAWQPGVASSSAAGAPGPPMSGPPPSQNSFKPNVIWIKGLAAPVASNILKAIADLVFPRIPAELSANPVADIRGFGKQFSFQVKDADTAKQVVDYFREHPISISHPITQAPLVLRASRDKSLDIRLKDRLLGILWARVLPVMQANYPALRLSNNRGTLWALNPNGEVWELFSAVVESHGPSPAVTIKLHETNLDCIKISADVAKLWADEATAEVNASATRFRFAR
jgi:hypothetical protein